MLEQSIRETTNGRFRLYMQGDAPDGVCAGLRALLIILTCPSQHWSELGRFRIQSETASNLGEWGGLMH